MIQDGMDLFNNQISQGNVKLFIFTPRSHSPTAIRTNTFNFTADTFNALNDAPTVQEAVASKVTRYDDPVLATAIVPSAAGVHCNTNDVDNMWSFALVIDGGRSDRYRNTGPTSRTILTGYFWHEEPIPVSMLYMSSPPLNEHAPMVFTHESMDSIVAHASAVSGNYTNVIKSKNVDYVPAVSGVILPHNVSSMCDTRSLVLSQYIDSDGSSRIVSPSDIEVFNPEGRSKIVSAYDKSPKQQMLHIAKAIDSADSEFAGEYSHVGSIGDGYTRFHSDMDVTDSIIAAIYDNLALRPSGASPINCCGVEPTMPMPLGVLLGQFPNMEVYPIKTPTVPSYERVDQTVMNIRNTMSAMTQSAISMYAIECHLSNISFRYDSYTRSIMEQGAWQLFSVAFAIEGNVTEQYKMQCINMFRRFLEQDTFAILKAFGGEFSIMVSFDIVGNVLVDLQYLDHNYDGGFYETDNRLGGLNSNVIGSYEMAESNRNQLDSLVCAIGAFKCGNTPPAPAPINASGSQRVYAK